ncbi:hypothetical protein BDB00DRAFT_826462 [Zychaea mexicana]|uniref:uncharacterized protein n=1 Tax=Zychaea mexicana TaxID=64656 RepID=UPI0022FEC359|nr:uncharacterized protein BDB00DRAFT_826462 [Zychaea mexicana]KAI9492792.1 hypothetical protein BDB00DRAFT_826462 [Zychaea mexicana]
MESPSPSSSTTSSTVPSPSCSRSSSTSSAPSSVFSLPQQRLAWPKPSRMAAPTTSTTCGTITQYLTLIASYLFVGVLTAFAITCLFCFFLAIRLVDDMFRSIVPSRIWSVVRSHIATMDWAGTLSHFSLRLARLAEWEKSSRASLYPSFSERFANIDGDRLHAFLFSLSGFLANYRRRP